MKTMRKVLIVLVLGVVLTAGVSAQHTRGGETFGVGIITGLPATGLSLEYWLGGGVSVDGALAWSFAGEGSLYIHSDLLYHFGVQRLSFGPTLAPYVGGGAYITATSDPAVGLRLPIGLNMLFNAVPLGVFVELVPNFQLIPSSGFDFDAGFGVRFYF